MNKEGTHMTFTRLTHSIWGKADAIYDTTWYYIKSEKLVILVPFDLYVAPNANFIVSP